MSSRVLNNAVKRRASTLLTTRGCTPRLIRATALRSTIYVRQIRHLSLEPVPYLQSSTQKASVAATIVAELQRANVRCTSIGVEALEEIYAEKAYSEVLRCNQSHELWWTLAAAVVKNPNSLSFSDLNTSKVRQWRSEDAFDLWVEHKVYKLWEALYRHSTTFKDMIDHEEKDFVDFKRSGITSQWLWIWMARMIGEGIVERNDVDNLPEVMFRDIIVGSGELVEKLASKPGAIGAEQVVLGSLPSGLTETTEQVTVTTSEEK
ncbi:hypothetical protein ABW20_dc0103739 [Dactylellina cionopaga]|nr:hypothetical protein ABW20_dc0103739 [Dactylellina cionopaga]